ncbi:MAG: O-antigen ligase family protein [Bacilli bacterium]|nr:O-antigen ligase family protein [Bacilli bacterium]
MKKINILSLLWILYFLTIYVFDKIFIYMHYVSTIVLLIATLLYTKKHSTNDELKNNKIVLYFILFFCYTLLSFFWASNSTNTQSSIIRNIFEMIIIIYCAVKYMNREEKIFSFIKIFTYTTFIMGIIYYMTSPISTWGSTSMGEYLGIWRNSAGYYLAYAAFFSLFLYKYENKNKVNIILFILLSILSLSTGSRKCIIHLLLLVAIMHIFEKGIKNNIKNIIILIFIGILALFIIKYNSSANYIFNTKILSMFGNNSNSDASTKVRGYFIKFAIDLFLQKPVIGNGMDGFKIWLSTQTEFLNMWDISAVYSHCNYVELLSNSGIIGFLLYYLYPIVLIFKNYKNRDNSIVRFGLCNLIVFLILDYGTISYYMKIYLLILTISLICTNIKDKDIIIKK